MKDKTKKSLKFSIWIITIAISAITTVATVSYKLGVHKTQVSSDIKRIETKITEYIKQNKEDHIAINSNLKEQNTDIKVLSKEVSKITGILESCSASSYPSYSSPPSAYIDSEDSGDILAP